jgi:hypothetical protein
MPARTVLLIGTHYRGLAMQLTLEALPANKIPLHQKLFNSVERARLQRHFKDVHDELSRKNTDHLPPDLRREREKNMAHIRDYRVRGLFPKNTHHPHEVTPYFRDHHGTICAVGYLMERSGHHALVEDIVACDRNIRVKDVKPGLAMDWIHRSGFTQDEVARIQPGYSYDCVTPGYGGFPFLIFLISGGAACLYAAHFSLRTLNEKLGHLSYFKEIIKAVSILGLIINAFLLGAAIYTDDDGGVSRTYNMWEILGIMLVIGLLPFAAISIIAAPVGLLTVSVRDVFVSWRKKMPGREILRKLRLNFCLLLLFAGSLMFFIPSLDNLKRPFYILAFDEVQCAIEGKAAADDQKAADDARAAGKSNFVSLGSGRYFTGDYDEIISYNKTLPLSLGGGLLVLLRAVRYMRKKGQNRSFILMYTPLIFAVSSYTLSLLFKFIYQVAVNVL